MRPPINGKQASAAATFEGKPVDEGPLGLLSGGSVEGGGVLGSVGSAMVNLDKIAQRTVK